MRSHTRTSNTRRNDGKKKKSLALLLFLIGGVFVIHYVIDQVRDATFDQTALVSKQFTRQANQAIQQAMADTQQVPLIVKTINAGAITRMDMEKSKIRLRQTGALLLL